MTPNQEPTGLDEDPDGVAIARTAAGAAYFLPASLLRLGPDAREIFEVLRDSAEAIREHQAVIDQAVPDFRLAGGSWSHIGAALGITGEAARLRYRDHEVT